MLSSVHLLVLWYNNSSPLFSLVQCGAEFSTNYKPHLNEDAEEEEEAAGALVAVGGAVLGQCAPALFTIIVVKNELHNPCVSIVPSPQPSRPQALTST